MYKKINVYEFVKEFESSRRSKDFSREALIEIYNYLTHLEEETNEEIKFDIEEISGNFVEYNSVFEAIDDIGEQSVSDLCEDYVILEIPNTNRIVVVL